MSVKTEYKTAEARILADALGRLEGGKRWIKGSLRAKVDGVRHFCSYGAFMEAARCSPDCSNSSDAAKGFLMDSAVAKGFITEVSLNDAKETTFADVESMFHHAITLAEAAA